MLSVQEHRLILHGVLPTEGQADVLLVAMGRFMWPRRFAIIYGIGLIISVLV